jgi:hypothetical protein
MIGKDIYTIDNLVSVYTQNQLEDLFISNKLPWMFFKDCVTSDEDVKKFQNRKRTPGIGCYIKCKSPEFLDERLLDEVKIIPETACKAIEKECIEILNARSFIHFPLRDEFRHEYDNPHVDAQFEHLVVLYYVNDSDGDTFIFDKTSEEISIPDPNMKIIKRITPKKGRAILFNGNRYHSSSCPTKGVRCILNFNVNIK